MSGFVCPNCKCEAALFNATSGGAAKMCVDFECKLLAKIPLDPKIQALLDRGESIFETDEEFQSQSVVIQEYKKLAEYLSSGF